MNSTTLNNNNNNSDNGGGVPSSAAALSDNDVYHHHHTTSSSTTTIAVTAKHPTITPTTNNNNNNNKARHHQHHHHHFNRTCTPSPSATPSPASSSPSSPSPSVCPLLHSSVVHDTDVAMSPVVTPLTAAALSVVVVGNAGGGGSGAGGGIGKRPRGSLSSCASTELAIPPTPTVAFSSIGTPTTTTAAAAAGAGFDGSSPSGRDDVHPVMTTPTSSARVFGKTKSIAITPDTINGVHMFNHNHNNNNNNKQYDNTTPPTTPTGGRRTISMLQSTNNNNNILTPSPQQHQRLASPLRDRILTNRFRHTTVDTDTDTGTDTDDEYEYDKENAVRGNIINHNSVHRRTSRTRCGNNTKSFDSTYNNTARRRGGSGMAKPSNMSSLLKPLCRNLLNEFDDFVDVSMSEHNRQPAAGDATSVNKNNNNNSCAGDDAAATHAAWDMWHNNAVNSFRSTWGFDVVKGQPVADSEWKYEVVVPTPTRSFM